MEMIKIFKQSCIILLLLVNILFAANIPNSGTILKDIKPSLKLGEKKSPALPRQEYETPITGDDVVKVLVNKFEIENNTVFSTEVLHKLIKEYEGKELTIVEIKKVANIISKYYRKEGYFVARAYIPAQNLNNHTVKIVIIEGRYGSFKINNSSNIENSTIEKYFSKFNNETIIYMKELERQIFLINTLSGLQIVDAQISPGEKVGTSDFTVVIEASKQFEGYVIVDNYGNKYTGNERASVSGTLNSPFGYGDSLNIYVLNSFTNELKYGNVGYNFPINSSGIVANLGVSKLKYTLGDSYKSLDAYGDASVLETGVSCPMIKSSSNSLDIKGKYTHRVMSDWMNEEDNKKRISEFTLSLESYNSMSLFERENFLYSTIAFTQGNKRLKSLTAQTNDVIAQTAGNFSKVTIDLTHIVKFYNKTALTTKLNTQTGFNRNLDSSQDLSVGGAYGLRAYGDNELSGDKGYLFSTELTHSLPLLYKMSHQIGLFYDTAKIWSNTKTWSGQEDNTRRLNNIGLSYMAVYKEINFKASFARGFGSQAEPVSQSSRNKLLAQVFWLF